MVTYSQEKLVTAGFQFPAVEPEKLSHWFRSPAQVWIPRNAYHGLLFLRFGRVWISQARHMRAPLLVIVRSP